MTPLEKFKQWTAENRVWFKEKHALLSRWIPDDRDRGAFMNEEWERACLWLIANETSRKAHKKDWGRFLSRWYKTAIEQRNYIMGHMTYKQEEAYYASKKRYDGKSEMEGISDSRLSHDPTENTDHQ